MGNLSNPNQWSTMERLRFIERRAYWCGTISRQDLASTFGLSMAQASSDLQKYQEMNVGALVYTLRRKRYEGAPSMNPLLTAPSLEEAMSVFLAGGAKAQVSALFFAGRGVIEAGTGPIDIVRMPTRRPGVEVERRVFLAVANGLRLRARYLSVNSGTDAWRWLHPRAFGHDGNRWHVRAWCEGRKEWRDFTLARIMEADWPAEEAPPAVVDEAWEKIVTLTVLPSRKLTPAARQAVELDYGMVEGRLELRVREAMANYLRTRLLLPLSDGTMPEPNLELVELNPV